MQRACAAALLALLMVLPACDPGAGEDGTTTTLEAAAPATVPETTTTTTEPSDEEASPTTVVPGRPEYAILSRTPGDSGDTVVVLVEAGDYTDLQLESVIRDVVETYAPIRTAHLIDDSEAAGAVLAAEPTEEEQAILAEHYLARLEDGLRLIFLGPYAHHPERILGS